MRISMDVKDLPDKWYNVVPDLGFDPPTLMSPSGYPLGVHDLRPMSSASIIDQELEKKAQEIPIPKEVREIYSEWRPTPLYRAVRFEKTLQTPAHIFYKNEGANSSGSHEANTAIAQAFYAAREGMQRIITATGNGEWGIALAIACNYFDIKCKVYMVRSSYEERTYGRFIMEMLGAEVVPSPGKNTRTGSKVLSENPESPGSMGIALSEAFEEAYAHDDCKFGWGSVVNHVLLHQTIIGLEAQNQMRKSGVQPDVIVAAVSGGGALGGLVFPFYRNRRRQIRFIAVETASAPSLSKGRYAYDYGDSHGLAPLLKMYTLGHSFVPPGIRAGGMRYHGVSPLVSSLYKEKQLETKTYTQGQALEAGVAFARAEGIVPSPETSYAVKAVVDEALGCRERKERKNILFMVDANSNLDLGTMKDFLEGMLEDQPFPEEQVRAALERLPHVVPG